jgi:hypothetical protein
MVATTQAPIDPAMREHGCARLDELATSSVAADEAARPGVKHTIGPDGRPLTSADLPPSDIERWVIRRKAQVVAAVRGGLLSLEEACSRYALNPDEFLSWQHCIDRFGVAGLRATRLQFYLGRRAHSALTEWRATGA